MKSKTNLLALAVCAGSLLAFSPASASPIPSVLGATIADLPADLVLFLGANPVLGALTSGGSFVSPGAGYRVTLSKGGELALGKNSSGAWFAVVPVSTNALGKILPSSLVGGEFRDAVLVVGSGGKVESSALPSEGGSRDLVKGYVFGSDVRGVELRGHLEISSGGAFGALKGAGWLPADALTLSGKLGGAAAGSIAGVAGGDDASVDLTLAVPSFVPSPYSKTDANRLEFGAATYSFSGTTKQLQIKGTQSGTKVVLANVAMSFDTELVFTASGSGYAVSASGKATRSKPLTSLFGIPDLSVSAVSLGGSAASGGNFSASVGVVGAIKATDFDATMNALVSGGKLVDVGLQLNQTIAFPVSVDGKSVMTLVKPRVGVSPISTQGYITAASGKLASSGFEFTVTRPALAFSGNGALAFGQVSSLDLNELFLPAKSPKLFPKLGRTTVAFASSAQTVPVGLTNFLGPVEVPEGLGLRLSTDVDLASIEVTKMLGKVGTLRLSGEISSAQFALDAALPGSDITVPGLDALSLGSPKVHLAYHDNISEVGLAGTLSLSLSEGAPPIVADGMLFVDSRGAFAASGNLRNVWTNPVGLTPTTLGPNTRLSIAVDALGGNVGFQAAGSVKSKSYDEVGLCLGIGATGIKGIGLSLKAEEISAQTALDVFDVVVDALAKASGPLAKTAPGNPWNTALVAASNGSKKSSDYLATVPQLVVKNGVLRILTPGAICPGLPAFNTLGGELAGQAIARLPSADVSLGSASAAIGLEEFAFAVKTDRSYVLAEQLELKGLDFDVQASIPGGAKFSVGNPGHFWLKTSAKVLDSTTALDISLDNTGASFEFDGKILSLGSLRLTGKTSGSSLATSKDIELGIAASDVEKARRATSRAIGGGMVSASEDLYQFEKDVSSTQDDLENKIDRLENKLDDLKDDLAKVLGAISGWGKSACIKAKEDNDKVGKEICKAVYPVLDDIDDAADDLSKAKADLSAFKKGADYLYTANKTVNQGARGVLTATANALEPDPSLFTVQSVAFEAKLSARSQAKLRVKGTVSGYPYNETIPVDLDDPIAGSAAAFKALGKKLILEFEKQAKTSGTAAQKASSGANPGNFERVGAAVKWTGSRAYIFDVTRYERLDSNDGWSIDSGYPKTVSAWKSCSTCYGMDAAFENGNFAYLIRGGEVLKWNKSADVAVGSAVPLATYFPSLPAPFASGIDAAEVLGGKLYLFEGNQVIALDPTTFVPLAGYPKLISAEFTLDAGFATGIDSALLGEDGKAYFFKGNSYIRFDVATRKQDSGYPKAVKGNW